MAIAMTAQWVERLKPPASGRVEHRDATARGLVLRVHATGSRIWYLVYRVRGVPRLRRERLGLWPSMTLAAAREAATRILVDARAGIDPFPAAPPAPVVPTLAELARAFLDRYSRERRKCWRTDEYRIAKHLGGALGERPADEVRKAEVVELVEAVARGAPAEANRLLGLIRRIYSWGQAVDLVDRNPCVGIAPPGVERPRSRRLSDAEIREIWLHAEALLGAGRDAVRLALLTAQRGGEILSMEWRDLDLDAGWWMLPAAKTKAAREHRVPLSEPALAILRARWEARRAPSPWVFPGRAGGPLKALRGSVRMLRSRAPVEDFRGHDFRRTAATKLAELGVPRLIVSRILNHAEGGVTWIYDRYSYDAEKRDALDRLAAHLMGLVETGSRA